MAREKKRIAVNRFCGMITFSFVLLNSNETDADITIDDGSKNFTYTVPAKSVVSYMWNK